MSDDEIILQLDGAGAIAEWFGKWPSFHDAEVTELALHRSNQSYVRVHASRSTGELDERAYYMSDKHALVTFAFHKVCDSELLGFNCQNVVSGINVLRSESGYRLVLGGCYGLEGWVDAEKISVSFAPGLPPGSIYEPATTAST